VRNVSQKTDKKSDIKGNEVEGELCELFQKHAENTKLGIKL